MSSQNKLSPNSLLLLSILVAASGYLAVFADFFLGSSFAISISTGAILFAFLILCISQKKILYPKAPTLLFLFYIGWNICITPFSKDITLSFWEDLRLITLFLVFLTAYNLSFLKNQGKNIVTAFVAIGTILITIDLIGYLTSQNHIEQLYFSGFFVWHNQMAGFLLLLIPLLAVLLGKTENTRIKILFSGSILLAILAMVLSYSRGGWIILTLQAALIFLMLKKKGMKYFLLFLLLTAGVVSFALWSQPTLVNRLASIPREYSSLENLVDSQRFLTWSTGTRIFLEYPIFGVGPGAFGSVYASFQDVPWLYSRNAHNHLLQILTETGLLGFLLFILLLGSVIKLFAKGKIREEKEIYYGCLISISGLLLHSLIDYDLSTVSLYIFFWLLTGVSLGLLKSSSSEFILSGRNKLIYIFLTIFIFLLTFLEISEDAYLLAKYSLDNSDFITTKNSLQRALLINPLDGKTHLLAADFFYTQGDYKKASLHANEVIRLMPYESSAHTILGAVEANDKNYAGAIRHYENAAKLTPFADPNTYAGLAFSYQKQGENEKAEEVLTHAVNNVFPLNQNFKGFEYAYFTSGLTNDLANLYLMLGNIKAENGETEEAERLYKIIKDRLTTSSQSASINDSL